MTLFAAFGFLAFPALAIGVMELDCWRKRRSDRHTFASIYDRQRVDAALNTRRWN